MTSNSTSITRYNYYRTNGEDAILGIAQDGETVLAVYWGIPSDRRARWIEDIASGDVTDEAAEAIAAMIARRVAQPEAWRSIVRQLEAGYAADDAAVEIAKLEEQLETIHQNDRGRRAPLLRRLDWARERLAA